MTRAQATRSRIAEGAIRLFSKQGVDQTSTKQIAARAGISEPAIYRHFASKDDLVWTLFSENYVRLAGDLERQIGAALTLQDRLREAVRMFCEMFDADEPLFRFLLLSQHDQLKRLAEGMANPVNVVRAMLVEAMKRGEIPRQDAEVATAIVFGIITQTAVFKIYGRVTEPMSNYCDRLVAACWRALVETKASAD